MSPARGSAHYYPWQTKKLKQTQGQNAHRLIIQPKNPVPVNQWSQYLEIRCPSATVWDFSQTAVTIFKRRNRIGKIYFLPVIFFFGACKNCSTKLPLFRSNALISPHQHGHRGAVRDSWPRGAVRINAPLMRGAQEVIVVEQEDGGRSTPAGI